MLDADLVKDCGLVPFAQKYPDRFVECGIAEQDMVSMACGLAHRGALPIVHSFACFLSARPNEQIYNQCSEASKVIYVGSLAGLLPGGPGHSHQSVRDISALAAVPNLVMAEPAVEAEVHALLDYLVGGTRESAYLRLVSVKWPVPFDYPAGQRVQPGRGWVVRDGRDLVVVGYGPWLLSNAWHAADDLERTAGVTTRLINLPWLNRVDPGWLREAIGDRRALVLLDNHYVRGGQGEMVAAAVAELGLDPAVTITPGRCHRAARVRHERRSAGIPPPRRPIPGEDISRCAGKPSPGGVAGMTVLFWDIDGTLLTTAKAGVFAWEDAVRELTGREFELIRMRIAGLTDYQIAQRTFETLGIETDEAFLHRFVDRYGELLPSSLPRKQGRVLPNVREILEHLSRPPGRPLLPADRQHARRRASKAHALRLDPVPAGRRVRRGYRRPGVDCAPRARPGAPRRRDRRRRRVRHRRHAARHRLRHRDRRAHDCRRHRRLHRSKSSRRTIPGASSTSCRRPTNLSG